MLKLVTLNVCAVCFLQLTMPAQTTTATTQSPITKEAHPVIANDVLAHARELYTTEGPKAALPEYERALALFRKGSDRKGEAITLGLIGNCYKKFGDFPKAEDYLQRALSMKRAIGDRAEEGKTLSHLGLLHWEMGDYKQSTDYYNQAIAIAQQLQDRVIEGSVRNNLGLVLEEVGNYRRSIEEFSRALELYHLAQSQLGSNPTIERGISDAIGNIGGDHLLLGDYGEALKYYQQSLSIDERLKLKPGICLDLQNIGLCFIGLGRLPEALQSFDQSIKLATEAGLKKEEADSRKGRVSQDGHSSGAANRAPASREDSGRAGSRLSGRSVGGTGYASAASAKRSEARKQSRTRDGTAAVRGIGREARESNAPIYSKDNTGSMRAAR